MYLNSNKNYKIKPNLKLARSESTDATRKTEFSTLETPKKDEQKKTAVQTRCTDELEHSDMKEVRGLYIFVQTCIQLTFMRMESIL